MGLNFKKFSWVRVGVGVALRVVWVLGFLFNRVELRWIGVWAGAHFGFGWVRSGNCVHLVGGQLLLGMFSCLLR